MSHRKDIVVCRACGFHPCRCVDDEAWLYKDDDPGLSDKQFLHWYHQNFGDFRTEKPIDIPWDDLVTLVGLILAVTGSTLTREDVARQILPMIRSEKGG